MKSITLKIVKENVSGRDVFFSYYELLKSVINNPVQGGFSVDEMQQRIRLLSKLKQHKSQFDIKETEFNDSMLTRTAVLEIEDADYEKLKQLVNDMRWGVVAEAIVEFSQEFKK